MRTSIHSLILTIAAAGLLAAATPERLDQQARAYLEMGRFQGAVLVARDGKPILSKGYGKANLEWGVDVTPDTKFRLGSVTKQFTGMAILLLEEEGKLSTADPLHKLVPEAPDSWRGVTIHHLLTHTGGVPSFTSIPEYMKNKLQPAPPLESLKWVAAKPLEFTPGERFKYSNTGYTLLGLIVERASGMGYGEFVQKRIFGPLGMKDTGYDTQREVVARFASGYSQGPRGLRPAEHIDMTVPHGAGALYSTVLDLMKWDAALREGKLLSAASYEKYFRPEKDGYAYGWSVETRDGVKQISHGGGIDGFSTMIVRVPEQKLVVVTLSNLEQSLGGKLAQELARLELGQEVAVPAARKEVKVPVDVLSRYVGVYEFAPQFKFTVTLEGEQLVTQATNQAPIPVFAESETRFFPKAVEATITFEVDAGGKVTGLTLEQGGRQMKATRR